MAKIQKIFFYTGTALVDPDATYGCPVHSDHNEVDDQGLCTAICKRPLVPVYRCSEHETLTYKTDQECKAECGKDLKIISYKCSIHLSKSSQPSTCEHICTNKAIKRDGLWGCPTHFEQQRLAKKPSEDWTCGIVCGKELVPFQYKCEVHKELTLERPGQCEALCKLPMNKPDGRYCCPKHPQTLFHKQNDECKEICRGEHVPLNTALGYRRNVSVFMDFVGGNLDSGKDWGFCVNVARDPQDKTSPGTTGYRYTTLYAGRRRFRYYAPEENWTAKETKVDDYLKDYKVLNGKPDVLVETASLLKDPSAAKSLGWPAIYKLYGTKEVDNCSSKCFADELNRLQVWLSEAVKDQKDQKVKVFAVCDCNSFHNSAYFFGLLALSKFVKPVTQIKKLNLRKTSVRGKKDNLAQDWLPPPVLILNFDRHNDDSCKEDLANSDGWGEALLRNFQCGAYLAIGLPPSGSIHLRVKIPKKIAPKKPKKDSKKEKEYEYETASGKNLEALIAELKDLNKKQPPVPKEEPLGKLPPEEEAPPPQQEEQPSGEGGEPATPPQQEEQPSGEGGEPAPPPPPEINLVVSTGASSKVSLKEQLSKRAAKVAKKGVLNGKDDDQKFESKEPWKKVWEEVQKLLNRHFEKQITIKYYYITIDRDCMMNNHTQWGDEILRQKDLRSFFKDQEHVGKAIEAIKESLGKDTVLTGMDITGLPESTFLPGTHNHLVGLPAGNLDRNDLRYKHLPEKCKDQKCPYPECEECRTKVMTDLSKEIGYWYKKFKTWCGA